MRELHHFKDKHQCTYKDLHCWLRDLYGIKWPTSAAPTHQAILKSLQQLKAKLSKLKKQNHKDRISSAVSVSVFLKEEYCLPKLGYQGGQFITFSPLRKPKAPAQTECGDKYKELQQRMYANTRNANKRLKRREEKIIHQQGTLKSYESQLKITQSQLTKHRAKLDRVNHRALYWRQRSSTLKDCDTRKTSELRAEIQKLKDDLSSLSLENAGMNDTVDALLTREITTFKDGKYTDDVRACIYELLSLNVGVRNVAPIIQCVFKNIAHQSIDRLPSYSLTCQMMLESLSVLQAQLGESLTEFDGFSTLQTDGTTKFGTHYETFDVRVPPSSTSSSCETYTLGLRHVFSGSSQDTLDTLKEVLEDIDSVRQHLGENAVSGKILLKMKNTMSDTHAAEKRFADILHEYRKDILPSIANDWDNMTELEQEHLSNMNNFYCGLHYKPV